MSSINFLVNQGYAEGRRFYNSLVELVERFINRRTDYYEFLKFDDLNLDLKYHICSYLDLETLLRMRRVSKSMNGQINRFFTGAPVVGVHRIYLDYLSKRFEDRIIFDDVERIYFNQFKTLVLCRQKLPEHSYAGVCLLSDYYKCLSEIHKMNAQKTDILTLKKFSQRYYNLSPFSTSGLKLYIPLFCMGVYLFGDSSHLSAFFEFVTAFLKIIPVKGGTMDMRESSDAIIGGFRNFFLISLGACILFYYAGFLREKLVLFKQDKDQEKLDHEKINRLINQEFKSIFNQ